ncbi:MAG: InlB B-repeat-containing protein [Bacteroidaceae bacterium]|nr:InlB B-repeat-containing protein [Bacteroidaceae bacterium]
MIKKIFTLLCLCTLCIGSAWGTDFTLTSKDQVTKDGITISFAQASGSSAPAWYDAGLRLYTNNTVTISSEKNITNITFNWEKQGSKAFATVTASTGTYNHPSAAGNGTWSGSAKSVTFTVSSSGQLQLNTLSVTLASTTVCTVQFDGNEHGTPSSESVTEESAGAGITLPGCTPKSGYAFKGWATSANATTADVGTEGVVYHPISNCTLYAVYKALYTVTIEESQNGTLAVKNGDATVETGSSVEEGTTLTIELTPSAGYKFKNWQYKVDGGSWVTKTANFEHEITSDVSFRANFEEKTKFTINYMVNGEKTEIEAYEGDALVFPTVKAFGGKDFAGWSKSEISTPTDEKPDFVETTGLTANTNITYYAVYVNEDKDVKDMTSTMDFSETSYPDWTIDKNIERTENQGTGETGDYAGKISTNNTYITFNNKVKVTSFGFSLKRTSKNENYNVYIETSTDNKNWEARQTYAMSGFGNGSYTNKTDDTFDGETALYVRFHCYNTTAVRYVDDIVIKYRDENITYTGFCTTVAPLTQDISITSVGYATAYIPFAATISNEANDVKAYYVTVSDDKAKLNEITGTIPAETGVVLKGTGKVTFTESKETPASVEGNLLIGTTKAGGENFEETDYTYYILSNGENGVGFYWDNSTKDSGASAYCGQYKAVLAVPGTTPAKCFLFDFDEPSGINNVNATSESGSIYNLQGVRVSSMTRGNVYIQNGKKFMFNK